MGFVNNISHLYTGNIMGRKRDLSTIEKNQIVKFLSNQKTTIEIAKMLFRDHRILKILFKKHPKSEVEVAKATLE